MFVSFLERKLMSSCKQLFILGGERGGELGDEVGELLRIRDSLGVRGGEVRELLLLRIGVLGGEF